MNFFDNELPIKIDEKGKKLIENAKKTIMIDKSNPNRDNLIEEAMNQMYDYFATYSEESLNNFNIQLEIFEVEELLKKEYLPLQSEPIFDENYTCNLPDIISKLEDAEKYLDYIVHKTRMNLSQRTNLENDNLSKQCIDTSYYLEKICSDIGLNTIHLNVDQELKYGMFHHFTIVKMPFNNGTFKNYLVDCTYRQFFTKSDSNKKRIGVMRGPARGCSIGSYMMMSDKRKEIAEEILTKGYIEAKPEVIKEYFDAIVFSGRDKSFYEEHGLNFMNSDDIIPEYSIEDYFRILSTNISATKKSITEVAFEILNSQNLCPNQTEFNKIRFQSTIQSKEIGEK